MRKNGEKMMQRQDGSSKLTVEDILNGLRHLNPSERKRVRLELTKPYKPDEAGNDEPDWLLEGFINELTKRGMWTRGLTPDIPKAYVEQAEVVKTALLLRVSKPMSYRDKLQYGQVIAQCLIYYLGKEAPISLKFLCNSISHVLPAVERSFPGYMRNDLMKYVIRKGEP